MLKRYQKLEFLTGTSHCELSILESRNTNQADINLFSGELHSSSTPQRMGLCRKADQRGLRKSSSLTNGINPVRNKAAFKEYGTEARGLFFCLNLCRCVHPGQLR
jgi:hypothetical protein